MVGRSKTTRDIWNNAEINRHCWNTDRLKSCRTSYWIYMKQKKSFREIDSRQDFDRRNMASRLEKYGGGGKLLARPRNNHSAHSTYIPKKRASVPSRSLRGKRRKTLRPGSVVLAWDFPLLRQWFTISRAHSGTSAAEPTNFAESATRRFLRYDDERIWAAMFCFFFFAKVDVALTERGSGL